jgi:polysaccharide pyruvyl transferase WcaK-like protein
MKLLRDAGFQDAALLIAADPASFDHSGLIAAPAAIGRSTGMRGVESLLALAAPGRLSRIQRPLSGADLAIAVGGGYLRFGHPAEAFKASVVHLAQIRIATSQRAPCVLLPQSIGPYAPGIKKHVMSVLRQTDHIFVRDDRSANDLEALPQVIRMPDLAVLEVASSISSTPLAPETDEIGLVIRRLRGFDDYADKLRQLLRTEINFVPALQSDAGSRNDDQRFLTNFGLSADQSLMNMLASRTVGAVLSVRLHGAVQSILAGVPAIHLSYERKGFSAFEDLGIPEFVHHANRFDVADVVSQLHDLRAGPEDYFRKIHSAVPRLMSAREHLLESLRHVTTTPQ